MGGGKLPKLDCVPPIGVSKGKATKSRREMYREGTQDKDRMQWSSREELIESLNKGTKRLLYHDEEVSEGVQRSFGKV